MYLDADMILVLMGARPFTKSFSFSHSSYYTTVWRQNESLPPQYNTVYIFNTHLLSIQVHILYNINNLIL